MRSFRAGYWWALLASAALYGQSAHNSVSAPKQLSSDTIRLVASDFLDALDAFYLSTTSSSASDKNISPVVGLMKDTLDANRYLDEGVRVLRKYETNQNEYVRTAARGSILGARQVEQANDELLKTLRGKSPQAISEVQYQLAESMSKSQQGYELIARSAPWITATMYIPVEDNERHGPIHYVVTQQDRKAILDELHRRFATSIVKDEELGKQQGDRNLVLMAIRIIRKNITPDTYEQAAALDKQETE